MTTSVVAGLMEGQKGDFGSVKQWLEKVFEKSWFSADLRR